MNKRLLLLIGIAITAVVFNHAIYWSMVGSNDWREPVLRASDPGATPLRMGLYYVLIAIKKLATFSVPTFLFTSGYFAAYTGRQTGGASKLKTVASRALSLLIPYLLWSIIAALINPLRIEVSPARLVGRILYGGVLPEYYFIPMLVQFTILATFLTDWARKRGRLLLAAAGVMQFGVAALTYASLFVKLPYVQHIFEINRTWSLFPTWAFYFVLGMVAGFHPVGFQRLITTRRVWFMVGVLVFGVLSVIESELVITQMGINWRDSALTLPTVAYALCMISVFLGVDLTRGGLSKFFFYLSNKTFGIYLIHSLVITETVNVLVTTTPQLVMYPFGMLLLLVTLGLGVPLLLMTLVRKVGDVRLYRWIFG